MLRGLRTQPSRRVMATHEMVKGLGGSNGDVLDHMPEQFGVLYQSAYEAGYRQGFRDAFTHGAELRKKDNGRAANSAGASQTNAEENSGPRLFGTVTGRIVRATRLRK